MRELRRLLGYLGPYRRDLLIAAVMIILETAFEMVIPVLMADIIDVGVANRDVAVILQRGIQMGVCALLALATGLLYARFTARAAYGWGANIREAQFERVQKYAFSNLDKFETSSLVTRMTTDVTVLQNTVNGGYRPLVRSPVMLVMGVGLSFWMNPRLALVFLVCAPVLGGVLFVIVRRVAPMYGRLQKAVDRLNNVVQEGLTAIRAVKAFVRGEYEEEKFQGVNSELMETSQRTFRLAVLNLPVFQLVMYTAVVLIMWLGGNMVLNSGLQVGQLTGFLSYVLQVMNSMMLISNVFLLLTRSLASARRISEVLDENIVLDSPEDAVEEVPTAAWSLKGSPSNTTAAPGSTPSPAWSSISRQGRRWASWAVLARPRLPWCSSFPGCTTPPRGQSGWAAGMCGSTISGLCGTRWASCSRRTFSSPAPCGRI